MSLLARNSVCVFLGKPVYFPKRMIGLVLKYLDLKPDVSADLKPDVACMQHIYQRISIAFFSDVSCGNPGLVECDTLSKGSLAFC